MTKFAILFSLIAITTGCATAAPTASERRAADLADLINEEVPDGASFKRKASNAEPTLVIKTHRKAHKRATQVVAKATPTTRAWVAGQGSTDPDDKPIIGKPGEVIEISFE